MNGIGIATVSQVLHCLKPTVFPIINGNEKQGLLWDFVLKESQRDGLYDPTRYIEHCRYIKHWRDNSGYPYKNYRIYDIAAKTEKEDW